MHKMRTVVAAALALVVLTSAALAEGDGRGRQQRREPPPWARGEGDGEGMRERPDRPTPPEGLDGEGAPAEGDRAAIARRIIAQMLRRFDVNGDRALTGKELLAVARAIHRDRPPRERSGEGDREGPPRGPRSDGDSEGRPVGPRAERDGDGGPQFRMREGRRPRPMRRGDRDSQE